MTKKIILLAFLFGFFGATAYSQVSDEATPASGYPDDMTVNPEQNKNWRMGQYKYSAKPKNAWELGIHFGHYFIDGDVDTRIPGGFGVGLHLRRAINYVFSLRGDLFYGVAKGLDPQPWTTPKNGGGLWENVSTSDFGGISNVYSLYNDSQGWFPAYRTRYVYGALEAVVNIGNILFHKDRNKWNWYVTMGIGLDNNNTKLDLLDGNGNFYGSNLRDQVAWTSDKFNTKAGRKEIKKSLDAIYDGTYETDAYKKKGIFRFGDETNVHVVWIGSMGISRKLSKRINLGIEHQVMATDNDYLDGILNRTALDQSNNVDMGHYTNLRLAINLGSFDKRTEPLYWLNPLDETLNDIAELKQRPVLDLTDSDSDGIIDMLDQEIDTPEGCPVDTRGVTLDSDGDGIADCKDKEPYSPPGYDVDTYGVASVPCCMSEDDINRVVDSRAGALIDKASSDCGKWYLPMIHFDLDKYNIKPEYYGHLHHVANVMQLCPNLCVAVVGNTDVRASNDYNNMLSYNRSQAAIDYLVANYGIDRSRFKLMYGGEEKPLIPASRKESEHYMNRRVEFRVCDSNDYDMAKPEGGNAGSGVKSTGSSFSGNKNSGF
ncbi:MAG: OmpA family protein [Saprospiraceae bacterium]|nr:OmpA family protein [Saprospiraceae bacterium]MCB9327145.1 OmpA family protein [Lewinellaceae bacterium]HPK10147.1 OmpA family protein [Saprospiraceae bacterium]